MPSVTKPVQLFVTCLINAFYPAAGRAGRLLAADGWFKRLPGPLRGWTEQRAFPAVAPKSFAHLWAEREATQTDGS